MRIENGRIAADSYLVNNLGFDLHKCLLLQARIDPDATATYRDGAINVHYIGDLPAGGQKVLLAPRCYASPATALAGDGSQPSLLQDAQSRLDRVDRSDPAPLEDRARDTSSTTSTNPKTPCYSPQPSASLTPPVMAAP